MLDIGTKVRIKSWEEIQETLDKEDKCNGLYFNPEMKNYCGTVSKVLSQGTNRYLLNTAKRFFWVSEWFNVVTESDCLNDGSIEQRSLCLALIRQTMLGNKPDVEHLWHYSKAAFPNKIHRGFFYDDYPQDRWIYDTRIAENIPDWPCLNLKPEILEEAIKNCLSQHDLHFFKEYVEDNINCWFIFNKTKKPDFWFEVAEVLKHNPGTSKDTNIEKPYKIKENEIKFQRRKSTILRGTVPEGSQQSSGKCKATTCCGYLSYQVCSGR